MYSAMEVCLQAHISVPRVITIIIIHSIGVMFLYKVGIIQYSVQDNYLKKKHNNIIVGITKNAKE